MWLRQVGVVVTKLHTIITVNTIYTVETSPCSQVTYCHYVITVTLFILTHIHKVEVGGGMVVVCFRPGWVQTK